MDDLVKIIPAVRMIASEGDQSCLLKYSKDQTAGSPEVMHDDSTDGIISSCKSVLDKYRRENAELPGFLYVKGIGSLEIKSVPNDSSTTDTPGIRNKIAIVTGGAQGFGGGISEKLFNSGVNVVVADISEQMGREKADSLNALGQSNEALFVNTDVSDPGSVHDMVLQTVKHFGGIDILVSNAGILHAGSLDEMEPEVFDRMTRVNYNAFYYCVKYTAEVLKIQHEHNPDYFTDIIQINSKSGLTGSRKNFAYAGAKFGGIGLTQSFALELAPYRIKVNSICPGNFYEGPLWSDHHHGLFVQYLRAGKVPGAKTIDDVRQYYEEQVPMGRGCKVSDIMKAILYVIDQEYETGQAIPVTGGQVMLG